MFSKRKFRLLRGEHTKHGFGLETDSVSNRYIFAKFQTDLTAAAHDSKNDTITKVVATYLALFIFAFLYQLVLVYDALRNKNTIQIIGLCLYNLGLLIEAAVQYEEIRDAVNNDANIRSRAAQAADPQLLSPQFKRDANPIVIAMPIFIGVVTLLMCYIAWKLYDEFAWLIYKNISADLRLRRRFLSYQVRSPRFHPTQSTSSMLTSNVDLHRPPQIRLPLLPSLHRPILHRRPLQHRRRKHRALPHHRRHPHHHHLTLPRRLLDPARVLGGHDRHHRTSSAPPPLSSLPPCGTPASHELTGIF